MALLIPFFYAKGVKSYIFDSLFTSVSAFCNAGFSVYSDSLASFADDVGVNFIVMILIILGGAGFIVLQNAASVLKRKNIHLSLHSKIVISVTAVLIVFGAVLVFLCQTLSQSSSLEFGPRVLASFFQSITSRTCGFETIPQKSMSPLVHLVTIFLMFIGGSPASMAGGIKTTTFFIAFWYALKGNSEHENLSIMRRSIDSSTIIKAVTITTKCVMIVFLCVFLLLITEYQAAASGLFSLTDLLFESVSAFATVGLSLGITPQLSFWGKIIIIFTMFIGRTGLFAMALHFPGAEDSSYLYDYPSESVLTG